MAKVALENRSCFFACFAVGVGMLLAVTAEAATINVSVTGINESGTSATQQGAYEIIDPDGDGVYSYNLGDLPDNVGSAGGWQVSGWSGLFDSDPVISHSFNVTNLLPSTQTFIITVSTTTGSIGAPTTVTGGSAQGGVTDANGDGATLSTSGATVPFYTALLDGLDFRSLYVDPSSVSVGAFASGNLSPLESFGEPIPSFPGPIVANTIGIRFQFDLSGFDEGSGSGVFVVEPVPEPSTALLLGLGLVALARTQRQR